MQEDRRSIRSLPNLNYTNFPIILYRPYKTWYLAVEWFPEQNKGKPKYELIRMLEDTDEDTRLLVHFRDWLKVRQVLSDDGE